MPINAHPDYLAAEKEYLGARTKKEKLNSLKKMISKAPSHKGAENLRKLLNKRRKKLEKEISKPKKFKKISKKIKKADMRVTIIGKTNTGKSSLLNCLTNKKAETKDSEFTTKIPTFGILNYKDIQIQVIEIPSTNYKKNKDLIDSSDLIILLITNLNQLKEINSFLKEVKVKKEIVFNKIDLLNKKQIKKISNTLSSPKEFKMISIKNKIGINKLKEDIFKNFNKIRVYTKEPKKEKSKKPVILNQGAQIKDLYKKIFKDFKKPREIRVWGPSSKFPGQKTSLEHFLKDSDIVEFKTR